MRHQHRSWREGAENLDIYTADMRLRTGFDLHDQAFCTVAQLDLRGEVALGR